MTASARQAETSGQGSVGQTQGLVFALTLALAPKARATSGSAIGFDNFGPVFKGAALAARCALDDGLSFAATKTLCGAPNCVHAQIAPTSNPNTTSTSAAARPIAQRGSPRQGPEVPLAKTSRAAVSTSRTLTRAAPAT